MIVDACAMECSLRFGRPYDEPSRRDYGMGQLDWTPEVYLERIRTQIPRYDELQEQAIAAIPFPPERVLELGMGTGETTRRLIEAHPDAWVVGLDSSPDMVFRARQSYDDVQLARMEDPLPDGPWDLVISVLATAELNDDQLEALCRRVKEHSRSFVIADAIRTRPAPVPTRLVRRPDHLAGRRPRRSSSHVLTRAGCPSRRLGSRTPHPAPTASRRSSGEGHRPSAATPAARPDPAPAAALRPYQPADPAPAAQQQGTSEG